MADPPAASLRFDVKLFAQGREALGAASVTVEVAATDGPRSSTTAGAILAALVARGDRLGEVARRSRLAVNRVLATPEVLVREGDEVALIPPVGGG